MNLKLICVLLSLGLVKGLGNGRGQYYAMGPAPLSQAPIQLSDNFDSAPSGAPSPYAFGYSAEAIGGSSARQESSDGSGKVTGSYTVNNEDGSKRIVKYIADHQGFRAEIDTNEAGTKSDNPADVALKSEAPSTPKKPFAYEDKQYNGKTQQPTKYTLGAASESNKPYSYSYQSQLDDGSSSHQEAFDGSGIVKGTYSLAVADGRKRTVDYSADAGGFKASIQTNEFGTKIDSPADVHFLSSAPSDAPLGNYQPSRHSITTQQAKKGSILYQGGQRFEQSAIQPTDFKTGSAPEGKPFPYSFSYDNKWEDGGSARKEDSDGSGKVTGYYSLSNADGRHRKVDYSADATGFQASIQTNEFGTKSDNPASVSFLSTALDGAPAATLTSSSLHSSRQTSASTYSSYKPSPQLLSQQPLQYKVASEPEAKPFPYSFQYDNKWEDGGSARTETSDGSGKVSGSYSLSHADGQKRTVDYTADAAGFKASIQTNEFGTKSNSPADVKFVSTAIVPEAPQIPSYSAPSYSAPRTSSAASYSYSQNQELQQAPFQMNFGSAPEGKPFPYSFNYDNKWDDGSSSRSEKSDGSGLVTGSYSLSNKDGRRRTVEYSADSAGFKAEVQTNEFGTKSDSPADVKFFSSAALDIPAPQSITSYSAAPAQQSAVSYSSGHSSGSYKHSSQDLQQVKLTSVRDDARSPYAFNYEAAATGGASSREEASDGSGKVTGSYSVTNEDGSKRVVEYIADSLGFRAKVKTNEPGTKSGSPADVSVDSSAPERAPEPKYSQKEEPHKFPARTYTPKSSMISQVKQEKVWF